MSWDILIGQAEIPSDKDYKRDSEVWAGIEYRVEVRVMTHKDAPVFPNDPVGNSNKRMPGYIPWVDSLNSSGLYDLFFDRDEGLMTSGRSSCHVIREQEYDKIVQAKKLWQDKYPEATPGFAKDNQDKDYDMHDAILARLLWLEWWFRWALDNCSRPAIYSW